MERDQKRFDPGFINCVTHSLTGIQVLYHLSLTWAQTPFQPIVIWCLPGDAAAKANVIRVALSRERKARGVKALFELRFSEPWPHTYMGIKGEAIKITRVGGGDLTRMRAAFAALERSPLSG